MEDMTFEVVTRMSRGAEGVEIATVGFFTHATVRFAYWVGLAGVRGFAQVAGAAFGVPGVAFGVPGVVERGSLAGLHGGTALAGAAHWVPGVGERGSHAGVPGVGEQGSHAGVHGRGLAGVYSGRLGGVYGGATLAEAGPKGLGRPHE